MDGMIGHLEQGWPIDFPGKEHFFGLATAGHNDFRDKKRQKIL